MRRGTWLCSVGLLLVISSSLPAVDAGLAGNWKLNFFMQGQALTPWLIHLEQKDGKWNGKVVAAADRTPSGQIEGLHIGTGEVGFRLVLQRSQTLVFSGRQSTKDANKMLGTLYLGGQFVPAELEKTELKSLDSFDLAKEELKKTKTGPHVIGTALTLMGEAAERHIKPEQVKEWAHIGAQAAEPYGPTMQSYYAAEVASRLVGDKALQPLAIEYAQQSLHAMNPNAPTDIQQPILVKLLRVFDTAGQKDQLRGIEQALRKAATVQTSKYPGRKGNGNRVALVELFTGAQCPPCVAADIAFDGLTNTFQPNQVVFLQYHLNVPGPDPLTNPNAEERLKYYEQEVQGTPTLLLDGKAGGRATQGGGSFAARQTKYEAYYQAITPLLDQTTQVSLTGDAVRKGDKIDITAEVAGLPTTKDPIRLRLALVEKEAYYTGTNGITAERQVVRTFAGGAGGFAITQSGNKHSATVDLAQVRKDLKTYQTNWVQKNQPYPGTVPSLELKNLEVVAFVQNDKTKQVMQALHVPVRQESK